MGGWEVGWAMARGGGGGGEREEEEEGGGPVRL